MDLGIDKAKLEHYKAAAVKYLSDPIKLRMAVLFVLVGIAIGTVYMPLSDRIQQERIQLAAERRRFDAITEVEYLRKQAKTYQNRIYEKSDTNEWVQFILGGLREVGIKLRDMELKKPRKVGPYRAVTLSVEMEGNYPELRQFVEWLEQSNRILRVDTVRFEKRPGALMMKVSILGLMRKNASTSK